MIPTQQQQEGNKIISRFVSDTYATYSDTAEFIPSQFCNDNSAEATLFRFDKMKFHSSWDWLYPVIQKVGSVMISTDFKSAKKLTTAINWSKHIFFALEQAEDIEVIYKHTVAFIQWYNKNKPA